MILESCSIFHIKIKGRKLCMHKLSMKHKIRMFVDSYCIYLHKAKSTCWYLDHWPIIWLMYQRKTNSYNYHAPTHSQICCPHTYSVPVLRLGQDIFILFFAALKWVWIFCNRLVINKKQCCSNELSC